MMPSMNIVPSLLQTSLEADVVSEVSKPQIDEVKAREAAQDFEAAYIAQMLTFSGLDKALMAGGGDDMAAFTSFYIESFADQIVEKGGFGLADKFYDRIVKLNEFSQIIDTGTTNVTLNKL